MKLLDNLFDPVEECFQADGQVIVLTARHANDACLYQCGFNSLAFDDSVAGDIQTRVYAQYSQ